MATGCIVNGQKFYSTSVTFTSVLIHSYRQAFGPWTDQYAYGLAGVFLPFYAADAGLTMTRTKDDEYGEWTGNATDKAKTYSKTGNVSTFDYWNVKTQDPAQGGTLSGGGTFDDGATCTITAEPDTGYVVTSIYGDSSYSDSPSTGNRTKSFNVDSDKTVTATFEKYYSISFYKGVATNAKNMPGDISPCLVNKTYAIPETSPTSATYKFLGWATTSTRAKNKQVDYLPGDNFTRTSAVTSLLEETRFYAVWEQYTLTYDAAGGSPTPASQTGYGNIKLAAAPSRTGYLFSGWLIDGEKYQAGATYNLAKDVEAVAQWDNNRYEISFDKNAEEATGTMAGLTPVCGTATTLTANAFTRTGYTFSGWNTKDDGTGTSYADQASVNFSVNPDEVVTLYAQWTAITYKIHFDANDGTGTMADLAMTYDESKNLTANAFTRTGYTFSGWNTKDDGTGTSYTDRQSVNNLSQNDGETVTLYAQWNAIQYAVTFMVDGRQYGGTKTVTYGNTYGQLAEDPSEKGYMPGYTFAGWWTAATGGTLVTASTVVTTAGDHTLYAHWNGKTYNVALSANSAKAAPGTAGVTATFGSAMPSIAALPTRTGYAFQGYYDTADASGGTQYYTASGTSARAWDKTSDATLYARWTPHRYNVMFDNLFNYDKYRYSLSCQIALPEHGSLVFSDGWPVLTCTDGNSNRTRYGKNGATGYFVMAVAAGTRYRFACAIDALGSGTDWSNCRAWYGAYDGSGNIIQVGSDDLRLIARGEQQGASSGIILGDFTTPAGCESIQIGLQVYGAGKSARFRWMSVYRYTPYALTSLSSYSRRRNQWYSDDPTATIGSCMTDASNSWPTAPARRGYEFKGWFDQDGGTASGGTGTMYTSESAPVANNDLHLWSGWSAKEYTLQINPNGGLYEGSEAVSVKTNPKLKTGTSNYQTLTSASRVGYDFLGFFDAVTGGSRTHDANGLAVDGAYWDGSHPSALFKGLESAEAGSLTIYARWNPKTYTATFDANGGEVSGSASKSVVYDSAYGALPSATLAGKRFGGWWTAATGGTLVTASTVVTTAGSHTLYAHWVDALVVGFDPNGGDDPSFSEMTIPDGSSVYQTMPTATRTGHTFDGWYTEAVGGVEKRAGDAIAQESYHVLYAHWTIRRYTATFNANGGAGGTAKTQDYGTPLSAPDVSRHGWTFAGWNPAVPTTMPAEDKTYTAQWTKNSHTVEIAVVDDETGEAVGVGWEDVVSPNPRPVGSSGNVLTYEEDPMVEFSPARESAAIAGKRLLRVRLSDGSEVWDAAGGKDAWSTDVDADVRYEFRYRDVFGVSVGYADGSDITKGSFTASFDGGEPESGPSEAVVFAGREVVLAAAPRVGYVFAGWFGDRVSDDDGWLVSPDESYRFAVGRPVALYARFKPDPNGVYEWEGSETPKVLVWRSKTYVASKPFNPSACRVDALGYAGDGRGTLLELTVDMFSAPDAAATASARLPDKSGVGAITSQDARRLPVLRMERYMQVEVKCNREVDALLVGTSMEGLAV